MCLKKDIPSILKKKFMGRHFSRRNLSYYMAMLKNAINHLITEAIEKLLDRDGNLPRWYTSSQCSSNQAMDNKAEDDL